MSLPQEQKKGKALILISCGTAIATSTMVAEVLRQELVRTRHYKIKFELCSINELASKTDMINPDIVITTVSVPKPYIEKWVSQGIKYFRGTPFITGIGDGPLLEQIISLLDGWGVKEK